MKQECMAMVRVRLPIAIAIWTSLAGLGVAATLERLSMDDMVQKSTDIVRVRVLGSSPSYRGAAGRAATIYTHYTVQVEERWKGSAAQQMDVAVPGGTIQNVRQTFPGAPVLEQGSEYVLFLWTSPTGLTQIIGLSQGLLNLKVDASGSPLLRRGPVTETMVDALGNVVVDAPFSTTLTAFRTTMRGYGLVSK
jgi:hypothetical protein